MKTNPNRRSFLGKMLLGSIAASVLPKSGLSKSESSNDLNIFNLPKEITNYSEDYWKFIRQQFPLSKRKIYLNTASLGASPRLVIDTIYDWTLKLESMGESMQSKIQDTRVKAAALIKCDVDELAITTNTTEGVNIIAQSIAFKAGDEVIITDHAHIGGAAPWLALQKAKEIKVKLIKLDESGKHNLDIIKKVVSKKTKVVVISHVTCTTGMVLPVKEIAEFCREKGIYTCIDGAHPLGMMDIDLHDINPDFYATSGHKWLLGPKGTGFLFINKEVIKDLIPIHAGAYAGKNYNLKELIFEHNQKAQRIELGTRSTPTAMGLGSAIDFINAIGIKNIEKRGRDLATYLKEQLVQLPSIELLTPMEAEFSTSIVTFRIKEMDYKTAQERIQAAVIDKPIVGKKKIRVRGIHENNLNAIRVSCTIYNNFEELDDLLTVLKGLS